MNENRDLPNNDYYDDEHVTVKEWLITWLLLCIPFVNIALIIYWAFIDENCKESKKTFFQAYLIMVGICLAFYLIFFVMLLSAFH